MSMMLTRSFRRVARTAVARRCFSDSFKERERAAEAAFFNQEDAQALKALQAKLRNSAASQSGNTAVQEVIANEIDQLRSIIAPHNLPEERLQGT